MYDVNDESRIGLTESAYRTRGDDTNICKNLINIMIIPCKEERKE
jgi:hypothetical protein